MLYLKEMEIIYYRQKCEQFLTNIDVIVNAKMSQKGNHMIYELDVTNRELRNLKDHYFLMEDFMRKELHQEYQRALKDKESTIVTKTNDFEVYKS